MDRGNGKIKRTAGVFESSSVTLPMKRQTYGNLTTGEWGRPWLGSTQAGPWHSGSLPGGKVSQKSIYSSVSCPIPVGRDQKSLLYKVNCTRGSALVLLTGKLNTQECQSSLGKKKSILLSLYSFHPFHTAILFMSLSSKCGASGRQAFIAST